MGYDYDKKKKIYIKAGHPTTASERCCKDLSAPGERLRPQPSRALSSSSANVSGGNHGRPGISRKGLELSDYMETLSIKVATPCDDRNGQDDQQR